MEIDEERRQELISKYRNPIFSTRTLDVKKIDELIDDQDLKDITKINNDEMIRLINEEPMNENLIKPLFYANVNFYFLAHFRKVSLPGISIILTIAPLFKYDISALLLFAYPNSIPTAVNKTRSH